jgi:hypothetical protein
MDFLLVRRTGVGFVCTGSIQDFVSGSHPTFELGRSSMGALKPPTASGE